MPAIARSITLALTVVGLAVFTAQGCSHAAEKWMGDWEGTANRTSPGTPDDEISHAINTIKLSIHPNRTFDLVDAGIAKSGDATLGGDTAFLKIKRILDRPVSSLGSGAVKMNQGIDLKMQSDGSILMTDPWGFDKGPIVLHRSPQP